MVAAWSRSASRRALRPINCTDLRGDNAQISACLRVVETAGQRRLPLPVAVFDRNRRPTMPPAECCTFLTLLSTTTVPDVITAPAMDVVVAHTPQLANSRSIMKIRGPRRFASAGSSEPALPDLIAIGLSFWGMRAQNLFNPRRSGWMWVCWEIKGMALCLKEYLRTTRCLPWPAPPASSPAAATPCAEPRPSARMRQAGRR